MTDEQDKLVWEIQDLQFEIDEYTRSINKRKIILERKEQQLKEMNDAQRNTNEAVEKKRSKELKKLQDKNWKVQVMNANYPMLEVIDENTVKIEGVEYKKVEKEKPQTLYNALELPYLTNGYMFNKQQKEWICDIVRGWLIDHTVIETEDAEKVTFTILKEQLQTPK